MLTNFTWLKLVGQFVWKYPFLGLEILANQLKVTVPKLFQTLSTGMGHPVLKKSHKVQKTIKIGSCDFVLPPLDTTSP